MVLKREKLVSPQLLWFFRTMSTQYLPKSVLLPLQYFTYITTKLVFSELTLNWDSFLF